MSILETVGLACVAIIGAWHVIQARRDRSWLADAISMCIVGGLLAAWPSTGWLAALLVCLAVTLKLVGLRLRQRIPRSID
jgi:hypothetical protein